VVVASQLLHVRLHILGKRLPCPGHLHHLPADKATASDDKGHDLLNAHSHRFGFGASSTTRALAW